MLTMLLSIKPQYVSKILKGEKLYEFRKNRCKSEVTKIIFYASSPISKVVGEAEIEFVLESSPSEIWEESHDYAGISKRIFFKYYRGKNRAIAYKLKNVVTYNEPIDLVQLGINRPPQSFLYVAKKILLQG